jgi:predicted nuclease of predicted toxin-antitoxin system
VNVLVDENLTPSMVPRLAAKGVAAVHVAHIGMPGATDPEVWKYAYEHDQIVVTMNVEDFLHLAGGVELHPGLIVLRATGGLTREDQCALVEPVIDHLLASGMDLVNQAVLVTGVGKFTIVDLPPP